MTGGSELAPLLDVCAWLWVQTETADRAVQRKTGRDRQLLNVVPPTCELLRSENHSKQFGYLALQHNSSSMMFQYNRSYWTHATAGHFVVGQWSGVPML